MSNFHFYPQMCHKGKVDFQLSEGLGWWWRNGENNYFSWETNKLLGKKYEKSAF